MINIVIVEDHPIFCEGLKNIIEQQADLKVTEVFGSAGSLYKKLNTAVFDVIVLDISLPDQSGIEVLKELKYKNPDVKVLILSNHPESHYALRTIKLGACGYVTKDMAPEYVVQAIRKISQGKKFISESTAEALMDYISIEDSALAHQNLSDREFEILLLLGKGNSIKEIAAELDIKPQTVSTYKMRLMEKLNLKNNTEITHYLIKNNLS